MQQLELERRKWEKALERDRRKFNFFLVGVTILVALAAIVFTVATIPNDSWILCKLGIQECPPTLPAVDRIDSHGEQGALFHPDAGHSTTQLALNSNG